MTLLSFNKFKLFCKRNLSLSDVYTNIFMYRMQINQYEYLKLIYQGDNKYIIQIQFDLKTTILIFQI